MHFFTSVKKLKSYKVNLRKKNIRNIIHDSCEDSSSESGDDEQSHYIPSDESEFDNEELEQESGDDPNNVKRITDFLVNEGLYGFATSVSGGSKSPATAMLWVKRTAQILDYTYYEVHKTSLTAIDANENDDILRYFFTNIIYNFA